MSSLLLFAAMAAGAAPDPITLSAQRDGGRVMLSVVGNSPVPLDASYELVAESGSGNRSVQRGQVSLTPDRRVVLVTLGLGNVADWKARLVVAAGDHRYERELQGGADR